MQTKRIWYWSKSISANRICYTFEKCWWWKFRWYTIYVCLDNFINNEKNETTVFLESVAIFEKKKANCQGARVKLKNTQLNDLKFPAKSVAGTALSINKKNFQDKELSLKLFQKTKCQYVDGYKTY